MKIYDNPPREQWAALCARPRPDDETLRARVQEILDLVRTLGDTALQQLSVAIDGRPLALEDTQSGLPLVVRPETVAAATQRLAPATREAICRAAANIRTFHQAQKPATLRVETAPGVCCIQKPVPIQRVGLYIPGGTAPLFSTVLMLGIPAAVAGCPEIILCTPAGKDGTIADEVLFAADLCGIRQIFCIGGAQAIAAMAYGTKRIPKVDKIFGPGNRYVTLAKQLLSADTVAVDMPAGPSEVMVVADASADPAFAAADLLSQAEHGPDSQVMLVCSDYPVARAVLDALERQLQTLPRASFATRALETSRVILLADRTETTAFINAYAPEHLILSVRPPWEIADRITAAGSIFVGPWTPESAGDYASGTNHTLPTGGWARAFSGLNVDSFLRKMTLQEITRKGLENLAPVITEMARAEGLDAHAAAVTIRLAR